MRRGMVSTTYLALQVVLQVDVIGAWAVGAHAVTATTSWDLGLRSGTGAVQGPPDLNLILI